MSSKLVTHNLFLSGPAGTGKTTRVKEMQKEFTQQNIKWVMCATTGLAAQLADGQTLHSVFGIIEILNDKPKSSYFLSHEKKEFLANVDVIFVDEVSMLKKSTYDLVSKILKGIMENDLPFGGKKLILIGDLMQLPPITRGSDDGYFFESLDFNLSSYQVTYLDKVHRQENLDFISFLHSLRKGVVDEAFMSDYISNSPLDNVEYTKLFFANKLVQKENLEHLGKLEGDLFSLKSKDHFGSKKTLSNLTSANLTPQELLLKVGAKVLFTRNDNLRGYANGNCGIIKNICINPFGDEYVEVLNLATNSLVILSRVLFSNNDDNDLAYFFQFPLTLGFALTIHKSQGMSLENATVDFSEIYYECPHLVYTAFSRVKKPHGLCVKNFNSGLVKINSKALHFDQLLQDKARLSDVIP